MNPHLHHARVFAVWTLRRGTTALLEGMVLAMTAAVVALLRGHPNLQLPGSGMGFALFFAVPFSVFAFVLASLSALSGGLSHAGRGSPQSMPSLPLRPGLATAAEVAGLLVVWWTSAVVLSLLGGGLLSLSDAVPPEILPTIGGALATLTCGALLVLPSVTVGRRTTRLGTPGAIGTMALAWAVTVPLAGLVLLEPWAVVVAAPVLAVFGGWSAPRVERWMEARSDAVLGASQPLVGTGPWHERTGAMIRRSYLQVGPVMALLGAFYLATDLWIGGSDTPMTELPTSLIIVLLATAAAPAFLPLGLTNRTTALGTSSPWVGTDGRAVWRMLPVDGQGLRRAALGQAAAGALGLATAAGLLALVATQLGMDLPDPTSALLLLAAGVGLAPLPAARLLGDRAQRRWAAIVAAVLWVAGMIAMITVGSSDGPPWPLILAPIIAAGLAGSATLVVGMLRPGPLAE